MPKNGQFWRVFEITNATFLSNFKHCEYAFMNEKYISLHENLFKSEIRMDGDPLIKDIWQIGGHF